MNEEKFNKTDVKEFVGSAKTPDAFNEVLEAYKKQNPAKYAQKLASGEFDKYLTKIGGEPLNKEVAKETEAPEPNETQEASKRGRKKKEEVI
jgi:anaerobic ribonucleoside-triphosphate reductase